MTNRMLFGALFGLVTELALVVMWAVDGNRWFLAAAIASVVMKVELLGLTSLQAPWLRRR